MRILALETATRRGSWALLENDAIAGAGEGDPALTLDVQLPGALIVLLESRGLVPADVDFLAVTTGPGSFTGLRVGIATMQGLAMATGKRVIPVPTLDAIAAGVLAVPGAVEGVDWVAAWLDGQRGEIFGALYDDRGEASIPVAVAAPAVIGAAIAERAGGRRIAFSGDAAERYRETILQLGLQDPRIVPASPIAPHAARLAAARVESAVMPHALAPVYVRRPDAELVRERRKGGV